MEKKRILVVEDEESLLKLESILFTTKGYLVDGVLDGPSALEAVRRTPPDLVVLDIMLPQMDGFEVCRQLKGDPETARIPVVFLTAKKSQLDLERGRLAGADAYLTKPFKAVKVLQVIEGLIGEAAGSGS